MGSSISAAPGNMNKNLRDQKKSKKQIPPISTTLTDTSCLAPLDIKMHGNAAQREGTKSTPWKGRHRLKAETTERILKASLLERTRRPMAATLEESERVLWRRAC